LLGMGWSRHPLMLSAAMPLLLTFVLGPSKWLGPLVAGLSAGVGAHLLVGAFTGSLATTWLPGGLGTGWLVANGLAAMGLAVVTLGVQRLRHRTGAEE
jgi:hypothetical protein